MTTPERQIQDVLEAAGDPAGAFLWRRVCRDLDGDLRIGVVGRDEAAAARAARRWAGVEIVPLRVEGARPTLGAVDRLLSVHALVWATPASAALGAEEREALAAFVEAGAPSERVVAVVDVDLLAQMADDPERELADVMERVQRLSGWRVLAEGAVGEWLSGLRSARDQVARERRRAVAGLLLRDTAARAAQAGEASRAELGRVAQLLEAEDERLDAERRRGRRTAAHLLGAMRRHTERVLVDLHAFLRGLEADLPAQIEAVDLAVARATVPHWLHHVVEQWMRDRLASWRAEVMTDLAELSLDPEDLARAELLVPAVTSTPIRREPSWGARIASTAVMATGAAMLLYGLWIPGAVALAGGAAWSALGRRASEAGNLRDLVDASVTAVRQMGAEADRFLRDQIAALEEELSHLGDERADELAKARQDQRKRLEDERARRVQQLEQLDALQQDLARRIALLEAEPA